MVWVTDFFNDSFDFKGHTIQCQVQLQSWYLLQNAFIKALGVITLVAFGKRFFELVVQQDEVVRSATDVSINLWVR